MTESRTDTNATAVVIGAGPAGAVAAACLAERGASPLLVDRARFPRAKVCGCCLGPRGVRILERLELHDLVRESVPLRRVTLGTDGGATELPFTGSIVLGRDRLDPALIAAATERGARLRTETRATVLDDDRVRLDSTEDRSSETVAAGAVLVADGLAGRSLEGRPEFGWRVDPRARFGVGIVVDDPGDGPVPGHLLMLVDRTGYLGVVRLPDGRLDLAAAFDAGRVRAAGGPGPAAAGLLARHGLPQTAELAREWRWRGTPTLTRRRSRVAAGRVACIGDAAGYVEPFTGEGMSWAMRSGEAAAEVATDAIDRGHDLARWPARRRRVLGTDQRRCRVIARAIRHPEPVRRLAAACQHTRLGGRGLARLVTGAAR